MPSKIKIIDIAKKLKMSPSTVSRALNNTGRVSKRTCKRVQKIAKKLGYVPNVHAKRLLGIPAKTIGVCCSQGFSFLYPDYYMLELTHALIEAAANVNHDLIVFNTGDYQKLLQMLKSSEIDGLIIIVDNPKKCITLAKKLANFPCVILGCTVKKPWNKLSTVSIDLETGAKSATEYLINLGHKKIGFIRGVPADPNLDDKFEGYAAALKNAGIKINKSIILDSGNDINSAIKFAKKLTKKGITATLCETDWIALGYLRAIDELGLKVPDDISIVGFNDCAFCEYLSPPLTTVKIPLHTLANTATQSLIRLISGDTSGEHFLIPTKLISRLSTTKI